MREAHREGQDQGPAVRHPLHQGQAGGGAGRLRDPRARRAAVLYAVAAGAYVLDRVTKILVESSLQDRPPIDVIPGVLQLRFTTNPGGVFGLFGSVPWVFVLISVVVVVAVIMVSRRLATITSAVGLGLVLGGALGNLTDRLVRGSGLRGEVVDFIDFQVWPVFNLADSAIVLGVLVLVVHGIRRDPEKG